MCEVGRLYAGQYLVKAVLGVGGMAEVYLVEHQTLRADFALKVLRTELQHRGDMVQRFRSESRALWELSHPSFVRVHHAGDDPIIGPFMVMEVLRGKTLAQTLKKNRYIEVSHAIESAIEIANACEAMHRLGIIHRDLKPENIFLTLVEPEMRHGLKLLDLGAAKIAKYGDPATAQDRQIGTGKYMSPEQIRGQELGPASDVYALAHIVFEMICGAPVFGANHPNPTHVDYQVWHINAPPDRLSTRSRNPPAGLDEALWQAMQKQPEQRFQTMASFAIALGEVLREHKAARLRGATQQMDTAYFNEHQRLLDALIAPSTDGKWSHPSDAIHSAAATREVETARRDRGDLSSHPPRPVGMPTMESAQLNIPRNNASTVQMDTGSPLVAPTVGAQPMAELGDMLARAPSPRMAATQAMNAPRDWPPSARPIEPQAWSAPPRVPVAPLSAPRRGNRLFVIAIVLAAIAIAAFTVLRMAGKL